MKNQLSKFKILFLGLFSSFSLFGQSSNMDFSNFKNYKIVLLGEQTHGDGAVFEKKLEIVKELHEKAGFNIIAFESGLYDNYKAHQLYSTKKEDKNIFKQSVSYFYSSTQVFENLLKYIEDHPKLKIQGFDSQESYLFDEYFLKDIQSLCSKHNISISRDDIKELEKVLVARDIESLVNNQKDSTNLYNKMNNIFEKINAIPKNDIETKVLVQTFKSAFADMDFSLKSLQKENIHVQNPRDKQMADNLDFLKKTFPNEKIIGWGANYHFANRLNEFEYTEKTEDYVKKVFNQMDSIVVHNHLELKDEINQIKGLKYSQPMGKFLKEKYGDELFSLAFTTYQGTYLDIFNDKNFTILKAPENSIETKIKNERISNKLEILKNNKTKFYTSVLGYIPIFAEWRNVFDGIYYIEEMYPPVYLDYESNETISKKVEERPFIEGIISDGETNVEIGYADIYYSDNNQSVVSDANGRFFIPNRLHRNNFLVISAIGYQSDSIRIHQLQKLNRILLNKSKQQIVSLNEVVVSAEHKPLTSEEILKRARKNITNNYIQTPFNQNFFFRITENQFKDTLSLGEEALIETYIQKGLNGSNRPENNFFGNILHIRNNTKKYDKTRFNNGVGSLWVVLNRDIILSKSNVLYRTSSYDLTNEGIVNYEGKQVYHITFVNNSPGSYSTGYGYPAPKSSKGIIYIDSDNYAVLKYEHHIEREPYASKKSKNTIKSGHKIVQSYKMVNGKYFLNLLEVTTITDIYSAENKFLNTYVQEQRLTSENIETKNLNIFQRPITELKKGFEKVENDPFWNDIKMDFNNAIPIEKVSSDLKKIE